MSSCCLLNPSSYLGFILARRRRKAEVAEYNARHKYRKRGIAVLPTKFGLSFTARWLNQAGALVHVYTDGSVLITHGGTEMGQGLHTKSKANANHWLRNAIIDVERSFSGSDCSSCLGGSYY